MYVDNLRRPMSLRVTLQIMIKKLVIKKLSVVKFSVLLRVPVWMNPKPVKPRYLALSSVNGIVLKPLVAAIHCNVTGV